MQPDKKTKEHKKLELDICNRIRLNRTLKGVSQENLALIVSLTRRQIQLYETGQTTITAGKLFRIAQGLNSHVSSFFPDSTSPLEKLSEQELHLIVSFRGVGQHHVIKEKVIQINEIITQLIKAKT